MWLNRAQGLCRGDRFYGSSNPRRFALSEVIVRSVVQGLVADMHKHLHMIFFLFVVPYVTGFARQNEHCSVSNPPVLVSLDRDEETPCGINVAYGLQLKGRHNLSSYPLVGDFR